MKVVCDNCRAVYKVPNEKLTKPVNKATCRQCGQRMLIPQPRPGADPEERTVVTAVPPTPAGAPSRMEDDRPTAPIEDERDETLSGRNEGDEIYPGTPLPPGLSTGRDTLPADMSIDEGPSTAWVPPQPKEGEGPRIGARASASARAAPPRRGSPATPMAAPARPSLSERPSPPAPVAALSPVPSLSPGPVLVASQPDIAVPHDPFYDLAWALVGTICALVGTVLLSFLPLFNHWAVLWAGLALSFGGGATAILILATSKLGRQPAWTIASVVFGSLIAITAAAGLTGAQVMTVRVVEQGIDGINFAKGTGPSQPVDGGPSLASVRPVPAPAVAPDPPVEEQAGPSNPEEQAIAASSAGEPERAPSVAEATAAPPPRSSAPEAPKPAPASSPKPSPAPAPAPAAIAATKATAAPTPAPTKPAPAPAPAASPAPAAAPAAPAAAVSYEVIDILLRNNIGIKRCFVPLAQAGTLPSRVDVKFTLQTTGKANAVSVAQSQYSGTEFEKCIQGAIAAIDFPVGATSQKITYPFQLQ
jgi:outer membrane biosynthesis protein TonB